MATSPEPPPWTIRRLLNWAEDGFSAGGVDSPRLTAEILLSHSLCLPRIRLYTEPDLPVADDPRRRFKSLVRRRLAREPVAYLTGVREFWGLPFAVTPDVLIPRPDTERLVEAVLSVLPSSTAPVRRILDLGTGSGAIAVALASERPGHRYVAMDCSLAALRLARRNAGDNGVGPCIDFFQGDWLQAVAAHPCFHVIVSNPPYIRADEWDGLEPEVADWEPAGALRGGRDGLDAYRRIMADARDRLQPGGYLFLEMGWRQRRDLEAMAASVGGFGRIQSVCDHAGHDRLLRLQVPGAP